MERQPIPSGIYGTGYDTGQRIQVNGEGLFTVSKGLRPSAPATGELTGINSVPYVLCIAPDGHSVYVPLTESVSENYVAYQTAEKLFRLGSRHPGTE